MYIYIQIYVCTYTYIYKHTYIYIYLYGRATHKHGKTDQKPRKMCRRNVEEPKYAHLMSVKEIDVCERDRERTTE